jgi:hypothetical protein
LSRKEVTEMTALKNAGFRWKLVLTAAIALMVIFLVMVTAGSGVAQAKSSPQYTPGYYANEPGYVFNIKPHDTKATTGVTYVKQGPDYVAPQPPPPPPDGGGDGTIDPNAPPQT